MLLLPRYSHRAEHISSYSVYVKAFHVQKKKKKVVLLIDY